jgi:hypothetical protein
MAAVLSSETRWTTIEMRNDRGREGMSKHAIRNWVLHERLASLMGQANARTPPGPVAVRCSECKTQQIFRNT